MQNVAPGTVAGLFIISIAGVRLVIMRCMSTAYCVYVRTYMYNAGTSTEIANSLAIDRHLAG